MNNQDYPVPSKSMGLLYATRLEMVSSLLAELRGPRPSRKARNPKRKTLVESFANLVHLRKFSHPTWRCPPWFRRKFRLSKSYHLLFAACICSFVALFFALLFRCFRENNMEEPIALTLTRKCVKTYQLLNLVQTIEILAKATCLHVFFV